MRREDRAERSGALVPRCPGWGRQEQAGQVRHEGGEDRAVAGSPECCGPASSLCMFTEHASWRDVARTGPCMAASSWAHSHLFLRPLSEQLLDLAPPLSPAPSGFK